MENSHPIVDTHMRCSCLSPQANAIKERIGYPDFIVNPEELDKKVETVSTLKFGFI